MFDKELTLETGKQRIGKIIEEKEHIFDRNHPLVSKLEKVREAENRHGYERSNPEVNSIYHEYGDELSKEGIVLYVLDAMMEGYRMEPPFAVFGSVIEVLANAIEHGANYGKNGNVKLAFIKAESGLLAVTEDPGHGFDLESVAKNHHSKLSNKYTKSPRGNGLPSIIDSDVVSVGSELHDQLFRVILLYYKKYL